MTWSRENGQEPVITRKAEEKRRHLGSWEKRDSERERTVATPLLSRDRRVAANGGFILRRRARGECAARESGGYEGNRHGVTRPRF